VAAPSLALALRQLECGPAPLQAHVARIREERATLTALLRARGLAAPSSQANFVLADCGSRASFVRAALAAQGVLVRDFPDRPGLASSLRVTLPGDPAHFAQLIAALDRVLAPEALLFDLDGVLADVRDSQRASVIATAQGYGISLTPDDVAAAIRAGHASNDWALTQRLLAARGVRADLAAVTARFQALYLGTKGAPGLRGCERLIVSRAVLAAVTARLPAAIVTGRPRQEARWFLERAGVADCFVTLVCLEDAPAKPDPTPVRLALSRLGVRRAWMVGNTPDDVRAAAGAGVLPLGVVAPGDEVPATTAALLEAGAARVLERVSDLLELVP
jgi:HAD superfamily hydrolase (TIGR01548 family)